MKTSFKAVFALLLLTSVLSVDAPVAAPVATKQAPPTNAPPAQNAAPVEKSKFALLNTQKENLNEDDLSNIFQQDMAALSSADVQIDSDCGTKLDLALKGAATDANALAFIFTQATEGRLCAMLSQKPAEMEAAMKNFKDTEGFTPVTNKNDAKAPARTPVAADATKVAPPVAAADATVATKAAVPSTTNSNNGQTVNTGNNVDPKIVAAQKAKQDEQMQAAKNAINNLFAQVGNKMNTNAQIPSMDFGNPFGGNNGANRADLGNPFSGSGAAKADLGAGLARTPVGSSN